MPDPIFGDPRLARIYDPLEPDRRDLEVYASIATELGARTVIDVGCGTGTFACMLAVRGHDVVGVDPAAASLDVARAKPGGDGVRWILGDATTLPTLAMDAAFMTGNVAQVFTSDESWASTLRGIHDALRPGGHLVFEVRDPDREAWRAWNREESYERDDVPGVGIVEHWTDIIDVHHQLVTFRWTFCFESTGEVIVSDSTLRFRERAEIEASIAEAGLLLREVRHAPDRPGLEFVFVCERPA